MQEQQFENFGACREVKFHRTGRRLNSSSGGAASFGTPSPLDSGLENGVAGAQNRRMAKKRGGIADGI